MQPAPLERNDRRIIIHFDYDCFYAAVFEREDPRLKSLPLAVQQKQIIVTCNYEARRRGLSKLQLVREARKKCPDVIIMLGEDLTRFRNASKDNYNFLRAFTWTNKVERLGFDEVFMDVTDLVDYNIEVLNHSNPTFSFFHLDKNDPTVGFSYDATSISGHTVPSNQEMSRSKASSDSISGVCTEDDGDLPLRLRLGSNLAQHIRHELEEQNGYTSTVGISTNKLVSKLVGNVNKPKGQTTLIPPYNLTPSGESNVKDFIDDHDIGKLPGVGFKTAQKIRDHVLGRPAAFDKDLVYGVTKENVKVRNVRTLDGMGPELLGSILNGPGVPKDLPEKVWGLINGVDDTEVGKAKEVPSQISIEDSYIKLNELEQVKDELKLLACSLIKRMRLDLTSTNEEDNENREAQHEPESSETHSPSSLCPQRWTAHPRTLRLTTRPRPPLNSDGTRSRTFTRISKSGPMPTFIFSLTISIDILAEKLLHEILLPLFHKLHPKKSGWDLSLVNLCATNMALTASDDRKGSGRDIGRMFRRQEDVLREWKVDDVDSAPPRHGETIQNESNKEDRTPNILPHGFPTSTPSLALGSEDLHPITQESNNDDNDNTWDSDDSDGEPGEVCEICGAIMPPFAMIAHERFHSLPD